MEARRVRDAVCIYADEQCWETAVRHAAASDRGEVEDAETEWSGKDAESTAAGENAYCACFVGRGGEARCGAVDGVGFDWHTGWAE